MWLLMIDYRTNSPIEDLQLGWTQPVLVVSNCTVIDIHFVVRFVSITVEERDDALLFPEGQQRSLTRRGLEFRPWRASNEALCALRSS